MMSVWQLFKNCLNPLLEASLLPKNMVACMCICAYGITLVIPYLVLSAVTNLSDCNYCSFVWNSN